MSTSFVWTARVLDPGGRPAAGMALELQTFDLAAGAWTSAGGAETDERGQAGGQGEIAGEAAIVAPALRLTAGDALLSAAPRMARSGRGPLSVDFGELRQLPEAQRFEPPAAALNAAMLKRIRRDSVRVGAVPTPTFTAAAATLASVDPATLATATDAALAIDASTLLTGPVSVGGFASALGTEMDGAQLALKNSGFSLSQVSITAKAVLQDGGSKLNLLDVETLKAVPAASLSDVQLSYTTDAPASTSDVRLRTPDVSQLTEGAARRVLASVGLVLEPSFGPRSLNPDCAEGQAMLQTPAAGAEAARGQRVHVVFAGR